MGQRLIVFGLSITSSWGNGHATTYRGLLTALAARGWEITFFERDVEWYRHHRDLTTAPYCDIRLYHEWTDGRRMAAPVVRAADAVLVGSYAGCAQSIVDWLAETCGGHPSHSTHEHDGHAAATRRPIFFYDIDTPVTLTALQRARQAEYLRADQVPFFDAYFSFTGGPALRELEDVWKARRAEVLYCGVDASIYRPASTDSRFACALGYMGTYAPDRQAKLEELLIRPAEQLPEHSFLIAGPMYGAMSLPANVRLLDHVSPPDHAAFYSSGWTTLNLTRDAMVRYGWSPSVRLFEAAACGACIVSDPWPGLDELLAPGAEILCANDRADVVHYLTGLTPEQRARIGAAARRRVLAEHTYEHRAAHFESVYRHITHAAAGNEE